MINASDVYYQVIVRNRIFNARYVIYCPTLPIVLIIGNTVSQQHVVLSKIYCNTF